MQFAYDYRQEMGACFVTVRSCIVQLSEAKARVRLFTYGDRHGMIGVEFGLPLFFDVLVERLSAYLVRSLRLFATLCAVDRFDNHLIQTEQCAIVSMAQLARDHRLACREHMLTEVVLAFDPLPEPGGP